MNQGQPTVSSQIATPPGALTLTPLPAFDDNYLWLLDNGRDALVVDPGDAVPVAAELDRRGLKLVGILLTHHHGDHVSGVEALRPRLRGQVYGPRHERLPEPVQRVGGGAHVELLGLRFTVLDVPGHTAGHIAYYAPAVAAADGSAPLLFCGDTLFSGGCGRLFEGTPAQLHASLQALAALPAATRVCCAHEYTQSNLRFAREVDPDNTALAAYADWCATERAAARPTLPARLGRERLINPFLRCEQPALQMAALRHAPHQLPAQPGPVAVLATLREWKNSYR